MKVIGVNFFLKHSVTKTTSKDLTYTIVGGTVFEKCVA